MLRFSMPRGDIKIVRFLVTDIETGEPTWQDFTEIYMSLKKNIYDKTVVFQKRLSEGDIEKIGTGDYQVKINGSDTDSLEFNKVYPFDLEFIYEDEIKQTEYGELELTPEVTCRWNEVGQ